MRQTRERGKEATKKKKKKVSGRADVEKTERLGSISAKLSERSETSAGAMWGGVMNSGKFELDECPPKAGG